MIDRLFEIIYILMEKEQVTAKELANQFEVSIRTIFRDIEKLSLAGIPVYTEKGKGGGIRLLPDFILNKTVLTDTERKEVLTSLQTLREVGYEENRTLEKLQHFFGHKENDWIEIDFTNWGEKDTIADYFQKIKDAIHHCNVLELEYVSNKGESTHRKVHPLKLCFRGQAWYLYGLCLLRKEHRFFKLHRILSLKTTAETFVPEPIGKVLLDTHVPTKKITHVTIEIQSQMAFRAYDELSNLTRLENGNLQCTIPVQDFSWFYNYIFSYGPYCKILSPDFAKQELLTQIESIKNIYK